MTGEKLAVVAIGGNALIKSAAEAEAQDQYDTIRGIATHVVNMIDAGWRVAITHGNGPQVGFLQRRSEMARGEVPVAPLEHSVAHTQGSIGFMFQNALHNEFIRRGQAARRVVTVVTRVEVDAADAAFSNPDKPIGGHMSSERAHELAASQGWSIAEDSGRGWRRVVASPKPRAILEEESILRLLADDTVVIACGGGGIPVVRSAEGGYESVQAVIDKDRVSALLAVSLKADLFVIPTAVDKVAIRFGQPDMQQLGVVHVDEARRYMAAGEFGVGSMQPKVEAILTYLDRRPGGRGVITSIHQLEQAVGDRSVGTHFHTEQA
ncbi:carbamate kinase [Rhodoferax sp. U2-2l]|uniref:carbamate kinase n=1 Tax=Rhodoferax sp. U2-2l TaxID=2884000 RepID=UPI001D0AD326|nr:carbamate kinase [Rhodoferax sp. U2-2l]MCB8746287.1 carbamate kinase [Rhodoferax sp. U2-2l]